MDGLKDIEVYTHRINYKKSWSRCEMLILAFDKLHKIHIRMKNKFFISNLFHVKIAGKSVLFVSVLGYLF